MGFLILVLLPLVVSCASCMPLIVDSTEPTDFVSFKDGNCRTFDGMKIAAGEWRATQNCTLNCTCNEIEDGGYLFCDSWCEIERTVCKKSEVKDQTRYFEEVGNSGCKRCITKVCDAIIPESNREWKIVKEKSIISHNITRRYGGGFEVVEETIIIAERRKNDKSGTS